MTKRYILSTVLISLLLPFPARSSESDVRRLAGALFINMSVSHYCRFVDGEEDYQAAKTLTEELLTPLLGADEAARHIEGVEKALKGDPSGSAKHASPDTCRSEKADAIKRIELRQSEILEQRH